MWWYGLLFFFGGGGEWGKLRNGLVLELMVNLPTAESITHIKIRLRGEVQTMVMRVSLALLLPEKCKC